MNSLDIAKFMVDEEKPSGKDGFGYEAVFCPSCDNQTILWGSGSPAEVTCHFCHEEFSADDCPRCGGPIFSFGLPDDKDWRIYCDSCNEYDSQKDD